MRDLIALPKAELHIHLEGSIRVDTVRDLAERRGVAPPSALGADGTWRFDGPDHFIDQYGEVCNLLQEPDEFRRIAVELCEDLAGQGVRYAEVVFSPAQHAGRLGDWFGPIELLAELALPLEVCPSSNVATGVYASIEEHPFPRLREAGVVVTLNSDDPAMFGSWVSDEYRVARDAFGFDDAELAAIAGAGVQASFADGDVKQRIVRDIDSWLGND